MASSPCYELRVLEKCRVSPPTGSVPNSSLHLTFFDVMWFCTGPVRRLFFYRLPYTKAYFLDSVLPALKSSLSVTLQHFYPLAGRLLPSPESEDHLDICYADGDSVPFAVAECDGDFDDLSGCHARDPSKLQPLVSCLPSYMYDDMPLLSLQVTVFPNVGFSIGVAITHVACDGTSFAHFVRSWAAACRSGSSPSPMEPPPSFDRSMVKFPKELRVATPAEVREYYASLLPKAGPPVVTTRPLVVLASFNLSKRDIENLRQQALSKAKNPLRCSTFMVACAHAWVCLVRTRRYDDKKPAHLIFPSDCRGRLTPPASPAYFGNCLRPCFAEVVAGDLLDEDGLTAGCEAIARAVSDLASGVFNGWETWRQRYATAERPMGVTGSPRFRLYDADFGWGKPTKTEVTALGEGPGTISLAESREEEGGIEIGIALTETEMSGFRSHFYRDLVHV